MLYWGDFLKRQPSVEKQEVFVNRKWLDLSLNMRYDIGKYRFNRNL